ncbi:ATP-dependent DNA helicase RecG [Candidatus Acetothermia bacterium]|nr:ATP-dependent DNA helicase RecG [Candidatus Acetothermia bacterium]
MKHSLKPAPIPERLRKVLDLEKRSKYQDTAVDGGLEKFIIALAGELEKIEAFKPVAENLTQAIRNYENRTVPQRRAIVQNLEDELRALDAISLPVPESTEQTSQPSHETRSLQSPVRYAKGVGPEREKLLNKLGIQSIEDLLTYFPRRLEDRSQIKKVAQARHGEKVVIRGNVRAANVITPRKGLEIFKVAVQDNTGVIYAVWFNQPWLKNQISTKEPISIYGEVERGYSQIQMSNPIWEPADKNLLTGRLVPIYPATEGLTQNVLFRLIRENFSAYRDFIAELIPEEVRTPHDLMPRVQAFERIHFPTGVQEHERARRTLAFEEFFIFQIGVALEKQKAVERVGHSMKISDERLEVFYEVLPFRLTNAQRQSIEEIRADMVLPKPMNRLLQGDVGSGKTVVAATACFIAHEAGYQSAIMAPTEILAEQHYQRLKQIFSTVKNAPKVQLLIGSLPERDKEVIRRAVKYGEIDILIGTHALIQDDVEFKNLGFAVIDEQHRFGVIQRAQLEKKGENIDILVMSATPIPRTITLTLYGQFEISILDELPFEKKIQTYWVSEDKRDGIYEFVIAELKKDCQAYIVYPLIEESEELDLQAATEAKAELEQTVFKEFRVALLHGRMDEEEKKSVMEQLRKKEIDVLVSTTIIEVGIDVPDATIMVIEHADRFGLAQLHQLRGRIGRAGQKSYCFAIAKAKSEEGRARLEVFRDNLDGFKIAEEDLKIRGPGELLGYAQHGLDTTFRAADLIADLDIMKLAREAAFKFVNENAQHLLIEEFKRRYGHKFDLARV